MSIVLLLTGGPMDDRMLLIVDRINVGIIRQKKGDQRHVPRNDGQMQRREAILVPSVDQIGRRH